MTVLQTKHKRRASNGINNIPAHGRQESSLNFYIKNPNNFIRSAIVMARSRQVKALTLSLAHHNINCSAVLLPVWLWHRRLYLFQLCADLPLSSPRHLPITRVTETLMTLIMWRGHMARRSVCVREHVCSAVLKADCTGDEAKLLVTSLRISPPWLRCQRKYGRGAGGANLMDSLHLLQNVIPDVPFCPARAGEWAEPNNCTVRLVRGHWEPLRVQVMVNFSAFKY